MGGLLDLLAFSFGSKGMTILLVANRYNLVTLVTKGAHSFDSMHCIALPCFCWELVYSYLIYFGSYSSDDRRRASSEAETCRYPSLPSPWQWP